MSITSPGGMISRDSCLQPDSQNSLGTSGNVLEGLLARGEPSSALFQNSKNLASSSCGLNPIGIGKIAEQREGVRQELQDSTNSSLCQELDLEPLLSYWRNLFSKLHDGNSEKSDLGAAAIQCWKVNFNTEVCSNSGSPTVALLWIKDLERANSVDDLLTSQSIEWRDFSDFQMLDAKIASAWKKILSDQHFPKKSGCRRAACSKTQQISSRKANCLHDLGPFSSNQSL